MLQAEPLAIFQVVGGEWKASNEKRNWIKKLPTHDVKGKALIGNFANSIVSQSHTAIFELLHLTLKHPCENIKGILDHKLLHSNFKKWW